MPKSFPARPSLEQLKNQAKELLKSYRLGDPDAQKRIRKYHSNLTGASTAGPRLSHAQLVIAREYGFSSWPKLKEHVEAENRQTDPMEELVRAVEASDTKRARRVLEQHAEVTSRLNEGIPEVNFGSTVLIVAVQRRSKQMIDLLLEAGADINARSSWWAGGFGVLDNDQGLASFLIERGAVVDAHAAARLGMFDRLKELITTNPALVHARGGDGQTPLHFASTIEIADYLLEHGADIDALDIDHESTAAQYMVRERQEIARRLVTQGCRTDILMATALGDMELVRKHLDADPDCIRTSVSEKYFPKRNPHAGGTIYTWTLGQRKTAHQVARDFGHEAIFRLLMERSPQELKLAEAGALGDEKLFRELLAQQVNLAETLSPDDQRKIVDAAQNNNADAVRVMLDGGWPVDARGQHGATALHWSCFHGNARMTEIILQHRPPLETLDADFKGTPLGWALHGSENGWYCRTGDYAGTVEALLRAGAKLPDKLRGTEKVKAVLRKHGVKE